MYKCGDVVLFSTGDGRKTNIGMILKYKDSDEYVVLSVHNSAYKNIKDEWIAPIEDIEFVRTEIIVYYNELIEEKQKLIRKPTQDEKDSEKIKKYEELKSQIKTIARRLSESTDDADFENRLKAIAEMKKNIFSIELECVSDIRKNNGRVKYEIQQLTQSKENELNKISDEKITKSFAF